MLKQRIQSSIDSTPERASVYFKTAPGQYAAHDHFIGIRVPTLRAIAKDFYHLSLDDLALLIASPFNEERLMALIILTKQYQVCNKQTRQTVPHDMPETLYQFYLDQRCYVNNWNLVDTSAHLIVGAHLHTRDRTPLITLAQSDDLWERRIAIVATWYFIRHNDLEWTFLLAKELMNDPHDLMHKAVGWMLREAGKKNVKQLIDFLDQHHNDMPRTMLRYSIEKFSNTQRTHYLSRQ